MEYTDDKLEQSIEETRQEIEEKRASMTEKLELLEERFRDTLEETRSTVEGIVENVKETVGDTVDVVKETVEGAKSTVDNLVENVKGTMDETTTMVKKSFDLQYQVEQRPWVMFGGSVLVGFMLGNWLSRGPSYQRTAFEQGYHYDDDDSGLYTVPMQTGTGFDADNMAGNKDSAYTSSVQNSGKTSMSHVRPRRWSAVTEQFQEEWDAIKGVAIGTLMGTLRTMIRENMPSIAPKLEKAIASASTKLGAEPIDFSDSQPQDRGHNGRGQSTGYGAPEGRSTNTSTSSEAKSSHWQGSQTATNVGTHQS